jgi:predicted RNA-binding protein (virulence factor B family)
MIEPGKKNILREIRETDVGIHLGDEEGNEVLLPASHSKEKFKKGSEREVFVYTDGDGKLLASVNKPYAELNTFFYLRVTSVTPIGAFLDWGLEKDLLVPYSEQKNEMEEGTFYVVYIYLDERSGRIVASSRVDKFLETETIGLEEGQQVDLLIYEESPLGFSCIINNTYKGLIYHNDIFKDVFIGDEMTGFVRTIREDKLVDISFQKSGFRNVLDSTEVVYDYITRNKGFISLNDKSSPEEISVKLSMSKATFKKAIGILYRQRRVLIKPDGVYLSDEKSDPQAEEQKSE